MSQSTTVRTARTVRRIEGGSRNGDGSWIRGEMADGGPGSGAGGRRQTAGRRRQAAGGGGGRGGRGGRHEDRRVALRAWTIGRWLWLVLSTTSEAEVRQERQAQDPSNPSASARVPGVARLQVEGGGWREVEGKGGGWTVEVTIAGHGSRVTGLPQVRCADAAQRGSLCGRWIPGCPGSCPGCPGDGGRGASNRRPKHTDSPGHARAPESKLPSASARASVSFSAARIRPSSERRRPRAASCQEQLRTFGL